MAFGEEDVIVVIAVRRPYSLHTDVQQPPRFKEEDPHSLTVKEKKEEPQPAHIKEEEEELWIAQEGERLLGQEEDDLTKFPLTGVPVKTEEREEKPPVSSQLHPTPNVCEEHFLPEQQEWALITEQKEPQPQVIKEEEDRSQAASIKEEDEDHGISEEVEEVDVTQFPLTVIVKSEYDEVKAESEAEPPRSSSSQHMATEAEGNHCGGSPADTFLAPLSNMDDTMSHSHDADSKAEKTHLKCPHCDKTFSYRCSLKVHTRIHTGAKPFSCSICGKGFIQNTNLKIHMRTHTGEKTFACSFCCKKFSLKQNLIRHMRVHTGDKPFPCSICGKCFIQNSDLKVHMKTHTGEKTFTCPVCSKGFSRKQNLMRHTRTHDCEETFVG
ncbi:zinc finger protein 568-like isoform X2 [Nerophis ophidion]|uniref:zinc finger protein 568-like isoform X2 n=1 Tax=Nerophis ophidion TaxID=159077 RepID=UPI002ADF1E2C|nr:zinc finger protein 568-like isoform X2 [Nerophis ophidion]